MKPMLPTLLATLLLGPAIANSQDFIWHREELRLRVDAMTEVTLPDTNSILDQDLWTDTVFDNGSSTITPLPANISSSASTATQAGSSLTHGSISVNPNDQSVFQMITIVNSASSASCDATATGDIRAYAEQFFGTPSDPVSCRYRLTSPTYSDGTDARGDIAFSYGQNFTGNIGFYVAINFSLQVKRGEDAEGTAPTVNDLPDFIVESDGDWGFDVSGYRLFENEEESYYAFVSEYVYPDAVDTVVFDGVDGFLLPDLQVGDVVDLWGSPFHGFATEALAGVDSEADGSGISSVDLSVTAGAP